MPDKFKGSASVTLYPGDVNVPLVLRFPPASGSTMNDGAVPYGSTIVSATVLVRYLDDGSTGTTDLLSTAAVTLAGSGGTLTVWIGHSTAVATGLHSVVTDVTWDLAGSTKRMTRPFDLDRIFVK